jgi:hypothetical protein
VGAWAIGQLATERIQLAAAPEAAPATRAALPLATFSPAGVLALQRAVGNRGVGRMLQRVAYTPGFKHDHTPSGKWADVQKNPASGFFENRVCANSSPQGVVDAAIWAKFDDKPIAKEHLDWYLTKGKGADFVENANIERMLKSDRGVQAMIETRMPSPAPTTGKWATDFKVEQTDYADQDLRFAFGALDRLDVEVDFDAKTVTAWFQDRYEWHPVYAGLYKKFPDDDARETNCVHAALVELQSSGAADYWMKGEATVPLSAFSAGAAPKKSSGWW